MTISFNAFFQCVLLVFMFFENATTFQSENSDSSSRDKIAGDGKNSSGAVSQEVNCMEYTFDLGSISINLCTSIKELAAEGFSRHYTTDSAYFTLLKDYNNLCIVLIYANLAGGVPMGCIVRVQGEKLNNEMIAATAENYKNFIVSKGVGRFEKIGDELFSDQINSKNSQIFTICRSEMDTALFRPEAFRNKERLNVDSILKSKRGRNGGERKAKRQGDEPPRRRLPLTR